MNTEGKKIEIICFRINNVLCARAPGLEGHRLVLAPDGAGQEAAGTRRRQQQQQQRGQPRPRAASGQASGAAHAQDTAEAAAATATAATASEVAHTSRGAKAARTRLYSPHDRGDAATSTRGARAIMLEEAAAAARARTSPPRLAAGTGGTAPQEQQQRWEGAPEGEEASRIA